MQNKYRIIHNAKAKLETMGEHTGKQKYIYIINCKKLKYQKLI